METAVDGIFFSLWTLMFQTDIIFRLQGLLFPPFISRNIFSNQTLFVDDKNF